MLRPLNKLLEKAVSSSLFFLPLFATIGHAQCYQGPPSSTSYTMTPQYWAPGQTYNVTVVIAEGSFVAGRGYLHVITRDSYYEGNYATDDPNVTTSNLTLVNPSEISFTVTIDPNAPTEQDAWTLLCAGDFFVSQQPNIPITPCANPVTPVISSVQPTTWIAGQATNVTITGSGFISGDDQNACVPSQLSIWNGSEDMLTSLNAISPTQITVTVTPQASDPAETASIQVANYIYNPPYYVYSNVITSQVTPNPIAVVTNTSNLKDGIVTVNLTGPSGPIGDLALTFNGSKQQYSQTFTALQPGSQTLDLTLANISPDTYSSIDGTWATNLQSVNVPSYTLPTSWIYFDGVRYTQYNVPYERSCTGSQAPAWTVTKSCVFNQISLNSTFISQTWINGTGISVSNEILKNAAAVGLGSASGPCKGKYPSGAIGSGKVGGNTFEVVSSVTGSCNKALINNQSAAVPASGIPPKSVPLSNVVALSCGNQLNLDPGNNSPEYTRTAADLCPYCSNPNIFNGMQGHVDSYSNSPTCTVGPGMLPDLGSFYSTKTK